MDITTESKLDTDAPGISHNNSIGLKMSTLGYGLEAQRSFSDSAGARVVINYMITNYDVIIDNIEYDFDLNLRSVAAIVDLGVVYQGKPKVEFSTNGTKETNAVFQQNMQKEEDELRSRLQGYEYYPVIGFGLSYRF